MAEESAKEKVKCPDCTWAFYRDAFIRLKPVPNPEGKSELKQSLTTADLISLGVGSVLGTGVFVVAAGVAKNTAGPAVTLSFAIAAFASILSGLCYAEFGARVPKTTGSSYVYSYVTVGEAVAFTIGWNLILEYVIGTAACSRALSSYIDTLFHNAIRIFVLRYIGEMNAPGVAKYPDFIAFLITIFFSGVISCGVSQSALLNNILNSCTLLTVIFSLGVGAFYFEPQLWTGEKAFFPYGTHGVTTGAASCFYAYIGFDIIATTGEEAKNPRKSIPIAIVTSLIILFLCYFTVSMVMTMMVPYYDLSKAASLQQVFVDRGVPGVKYFIIIGAIAGLTASLMGSLFPMPRIIYAMALDCLIFNVFAKIYKRTQMPILATMSAGLLTGVLACIFTEEDLIQMMSIGTLLAYTLVSTSVLILRFQPQTEYEMQYADEYRSARTEEVSQAKEEAKTLQGKAKVGHYAGRFKSTVKNDTPNWTSSLVVNWSIAGCTIFMFSFNALLIYGGWALIQGAAWAIILIIVFGLVTVGFIVVIAIQPQSQKELLFKAPCVPGLPILAIYCNTFLILKLTLFTWIRFGIWMVIGCSIYLTYGVSNSIQRDLSNDGTDEERIKLTQYNEDNEKEAPTEGSDEDVKK